MFHFPHSVAAAGPCPWQDTRKPVERSDVAAPTGWPRFATRASLLPERALSPKCSLKLSDAPRNQPPCKANWSRMSASPPVPFSCTPPPHRSAANRMGQTGLLSPPVGSPERPASRPRSVANRARCVVDVSPFRGFNQPCVGTPSEGLEAPFPPRPAPPHPSSSAPCFPSHPPFPAASCPPPSNEFHWIWPERTLSTKCSLFTSCRG